MKIFFQNNSDKIILYTVKLVIDRHPIINGHLEMDRKYSRAPWNRRAPLVITENVLTMSKRNSKIKKMTRKKRMIKRKNRMSKVRNRTNE